MNTSGRVWIEEGVNPDLQEERNKATFDVDRLTFILDGGKEATKKRRQIETEALSDPEVTKVPSTIHLNSTDLYSDSLRKSVHFIRQARLGKFQDHTDLTHYLHVVHVVRLMLATPFAMASSGRELHSLLQPNDGLPVTIHHIMIINTLENQCTEEQAKKWLRLAKDYRMIATYAQTELGHGTNLRALETTATYDPQHEHFVLHTPTLTSMKWWPGGLAKTATHAIVVAALIIGDRNHGPHHFMIQLRSSNGHMPLTGIEVGHIGSKFGANSVDNGYLRLNKVTIPREHMLMKTAIVEPNGKYSRTTKDSKPAYSTMTFVRSFLVLDLGARSLAQACTIAIRYSCIRRQSQLEPGAREPKVMEYQTQQYKLLPHLASAYAMWFVGARMNAVDTEISHRISEGDSNRLPELHALSSGMKAFSSISMMLGVEQCRLGCGGHGYSLASGLPKIYSYSVALCTIEGENTVLYLQTARYLMKSLKQAKKEKKTTHSVSYLSEKSLTWCTIDSSMQPEAVVKAYAFRARSLIDKAANSLNHYEISGKPYHDAWNMSSVELSKAAEAHCHLYTVSTFADCIEKVKDQVSIHRVLSELFRLYSSYGIVNNSADFLRDGFMSEGQLDLIQKCMLKALADLRPNAVPLVDAFDFADQMLDSVLGRYDGNVYENLYKWAKHSPLNRSQVHESYEQYLKPILEEKSKL